MITIYSQTYIADNAGISVSWLIKIVKGNKLSEDTNPDYIDNAGTPYWNEGKAQLLIERLKTNKTIHPRLKRIY